MTSVEFTDDEIREELSHLGYHDVPQDKLEDFKRDLMSLILTERSKASSLDSSQVTESEAKENYHQEPISDADSSPEGNFSNHSSQHLGSKFREDWNYGAESRPQTAPEQRGRQARGRRTESGSSLNSEHLAPFSLGRNQSCCDDVSETDSECRFMKRKTSRKTADGCRLIDESFTDSESGVFEIYEKMKRLAMRECECGKTRPKSGDIVPPYRMKKVNKYPSVIRTTEPPHTRNLVRTNPFERHNQYKKLWKEWPVVGETDRIALRKAMHAKLLHSEGIKLKQKVYVPNLYVPPHEKDRHDIRWKVRQAIEHYEMPEHGFYHDI